MNNQQAIDRLVKHLEWGWIEETVEAIEMGIHALKETQWIPCSEKMPEDNTDVIVCFYSGTVTEMRYWGSVDHDDLGNGDEYNGCIMFGCNHPKYAKMIKKEILKYMKERRKHR